MVFKYYLCYNTLEMRIMSGKELLLKIIKKENSKKYGFNNENEVVEYEKYLNKIEIDKNEDYSLLIFTFIFFALPIYFLFSIKSSDLAILVILIFFGFFAFIKIKNNAKKRLIRKSEKFSNYCAYKQNNSLYQFIKKHNIDSYYEEITKRGEDLSLEKIFPCFEELKWIIVFLDHYTYSNKYHFDKDGEIIKFNLELNAKYEMEMKKIILMDLIKKYLSLACINKIKGDFRFLEYLHSVNFIREYCNSDVFNSKIEDKDVYDLANYFVKKYHKTENIGNIEVINLQLDKLKKSFEKKNNINKKKYTLQENNEIEKESDGDLDYEYDEDLEDMYDREEYDENLEKFDNSDEELEDTIEGNYEEDIDENDEFFKEEFEFSYAKVKEVLKKLGYDNYATFKKEVYNSRKIKRKKFENKEDEINYLVKALGYEDFEDFYNTNIENDD